jgi:glycosyltransferase involved in cell wall biosynthesis
LLQLQRAFDVHLVAFSRRNHQPDAAARQAARDSLARHLTAVYEPSAIPAEWSAVARAGNHFRSILGSNPYVRYDYRSATFGQSLARATAAVQPALVHLDSLDLYGWIPTISRVPLAVTHHSVESDLLRSRAKRVGSAPLRAYLRHQARLLERVERSVSPKVAINIMMSDVDAEKLHGIAPRARTAVVPNGVDTEYFSPRPAEADPLTVAFVGPTYMYPNRDAVDWFLEWVWSTVRAAVPGVQLHLIGRASPSDRTRYEQIEGVRCHGYVPDVRPYLARSSCSVVPIRIGGGTRLKILDSWAMGVPVVSTSVGCEGLATKENENIVVRDDPQGFAAAVIQVLGDRAVNARLAANGRATAERSYSWRSIGDHIIAIYRTLISTAGADHGAGDA